MTQEQRAALMYAQTCLRRIALQLERDLGMDIWRQVVSIASDPTPAVRAELKRLSAEARSIHNCFNEATAEREFRILLAENADSLIRAAEERDALSLELQAEREDNAAAHRRLAERDGLSAELATRDTKILRLSDTITGLRETCDDLRRQLAESLDLCVYLRQEIEERTRK